MKATILPEAILFTEAHRGGVSMNAKGSIVAEYCL